MTNIHVSWAKKPAKREILDMWKEELGFGANCYICGKEIDEHGVLDGYYPYYVEYNRCKDCSDKTIQ